MASASGLQPAPRFRNTSNRRAETERRERLSGLDPLTSPGAGEEATFALLIAGQDREMDRQRHAQVGERLSHARRVDSSVVNDQQVDLACGLRCLRAGTKQIPVRTGKLCSGR